MRPRGPRPSTGPVASLGVAALVLAATACAATPWEGTARDPARVSFAPELAVDLAAFEQIAPGLYVQELAPGDGAVARRGDLVSIQFALWLPDGSLVDTSVGAAPFQFRLGEGEVIRGWTLGIPGMAVGGRRKLVVRPGLGYGSRGSARVPPDATLVFEVELVGIR